MHKHFFKSVFLLSLFFITSQAQAATCFSAAGMNWSTTQWFCPNPPSTPPTSIDDAEVGINLTVDQNVNVNSITIDAMRTLNASSFTLTLAAPTPLIVHGTFNAGTSTVKLSDADHTLGSNVTFYNLQWATTPITAPRTIVINGAIVIAAGGAFSLDGSSSTNKVTFTGTGSVSPAVTLTNCTSTVTGINCGGGGGAAVSAPIGISLGTKPVIFSREVVR